MIPLWLALASLGGMVVGLMLAFVGIAFVGHVFARTTVRGS